MPEKTIFQHKTTTKDTVNPVNPNDVKEANLYGHPQEPVDVISVSTVTNSWPSTSRYSEPMPLRRTKDSNILDTVVEEDHGDGMPAVE